MGGPLRPDWGSLAGWVPPLRKEDGQGGWITTIMDKQVKLCDHLQFSHRKRANPYGQSIGSILF